MICAIRNKNGSITLKEMSRIRYWFASKESKELTQLFMYFVSEYAELISEDTDIQVLFNTYVLLLEGGLFHPEAFKKTLQSFTNNIDTEGVSM